MLDNGVVQNIESFDLGSEPLSAVLVFETSSQIAPLLPAVQKSAIVFTQTVIGPSGDAAVLGYNDAVEHLLPFTADRDKIEKTITNLKPGNSGARLYDALSTAVGLLRDRPPSRRRVIIVVAEARDSGSEEKLGAVLREAQLSNIVIYSVGLSTTAAALRSPPSQSGPIQATPPGTFGRPPIPGTAQTPTSEEQRSGNIDLLALAVWAVQHATAVVKDRPLEVATVATGGMYQSTFRDKLDRKCGGCDWRRAQRPVHVNLSPHQLRFRRFSPDQSGRGSPRSEGPHASGLLHRTKVVAPFADHPTMDTIPSMCSPTSASPVT